MCMGTGSSVPATGCIPSVDGEPTFSTFPSCVTGPASIYGTTPTSYLKLTSCTNSALTISFGLGTCTRIDALSAVFSVVNSTLFFNIFLTIDCSGTAVGTSNITLSSTCSAGAPFSVSVTSTATNLQQTLGPVTQTTAAPDCANTTCPTTFSTDSIVVALGSLLLNTAPTNAPAAAPSASSSSAASCFAKTEMVTMESGVDMPIADVRVGDRVLAASSAGILSYATVIALPHGDNDLPAVFVKLSTESDRDLKLTADHLLFAGVCGEKSTLRRAGDVSPGLCIATVAGQEKVAAVSREAGIGLYTLVTTAEYVVVGGVVASPFATSHTVPNSFYAHFRAIHGYFPGMFASKWFTRAFERFGTFSMETF